MAGVNTLPEILWPMMGQPSISTDDGRCAICGRNSHSARIEKHHIVRRGAGVLYDQNGRELKKPTIMLCGDGNVLRDADGRYLCHGLAHHHMLHFRWSKYHAKDSLGYKLYTIPGGYWEYLITEEPTKYQDALEMDGWRRLRFGE